MSNSSIDLSFFTPGNYSNPSKHLSPLSFSIFTSEFFMQAFSTTGCVLLMITIYSTRCFNTNLRFLLMAFDFALLVQILARYLIITPLMLAFMFNKDVSCKCSASPWLADKFSITRAIPAFGYCRIAKAMHDTSYYVINSSVFNLALERLASTIMVASYETNRYYFICLLGVIIQWLIAIAFVTINQNSTLSLGMPRLPCQIEYGNSSSMTYATILFAAENIFSLVVFIILLNFNKRRDQMNHHFLVPLSQRYQTTENVYTTRLLWPLVVFLLIITCISNIILYILSKVMLGLMVAGKFASVIGIVGPRGELMQTIDIVLACYEFFFPIVILRGNKALQKKFKENFCLSKKIHKTVPPKSLNGKLLVMQTSEEADFHFNSLQKMWN